MVLKKFNKLGFKVGLVSGKMSDKGKPENDIILYLCTETGIPFTRIGSYIHSELNDSSSNHIPSITFFRDFDTYFNIIQEFLKAQLVNQPIISENIP
jgi:hypothetical protein